MVNLLKRQEGESVSQFELRLGLGKINGIKPYVDYNWDELCKVLGIHGTSRVFRGKMYGAKQLMDEIEKQSITEESILNDIEIQRIELQKERNKLQTLRVEFNRMTREQARTELFLEYVEKCTESMESFDLPYELLEVGEKNGKVMLVSVADAHVGKSSEVKGLKGEIINKYDFTVFKERMTTLMEKTLEIAYKEEVDKIVVVGLGDNVDGILRYSQLQSLQYGVVDSVLHYSEFMANWLNEISRFFKIEYHSAYGNHASLRLLNAKSSKDFPNENMEKIIDTFIETRLKGNPNIDIKNNNMPHSYFNICGVNILAIHGEEKNLGQTLKDFRMMYGEDVHMIIAGHLHSNQTLDVGIAPLGNIEVLRVPSICGVDEFSMQLHKMSRAGSKAIVFEDNVGKTIEYSIYL